jgi:hypothetical protein
VVELTFENLYPLAGLLVIGVTIWGMSKKFTGMDMTIQNNQKDNERDDALNNNRIKQNEDDLASLRKDVKDIYIILLKLQQKVEDKLK